MSQVLSKLVKEIRSCTLCAKHLPLGPRPIIQVSSSAKILIVGQAPGSQVHETGIPFNDPSGDRLREWMGIDKEVFYDDKKIALVPMGFCFPGTGKSGDLPPRAECADTWRVKLLEQLPNIKLTMAKSTSHELKSELKFGKNLVFIHDSVLILFSGSTFNLKLFFSPRPLSQKTNPWICC